MVVINIAGEAYHLQVVLPLARDTGCKTRCVITPMLTEEFKDDAQELIKVAEPNEEEDRANLVIFGDFL